MNLDDFTVSCVGNITTGDVVVFEEAVSLGKHTKYLGNRTVVAEVIKDHYDESQQHIFTFLILYCAGTDPLEKNSVEVRRASLIYRRGVMRKPWDNEDSRPVSYDTKVGVKIIDPKRMKKYR